MAVVAGIAATSNYCDADEETQRTTQGGPEKTPHAGQDPPPEVESLSPRPAAGFLFACLLGQVFASPALLLFARGSLVMPKKTLRQREAELRSLLATPAGRIELQALEARYAAAAGTVRPARASLITYLLVYEREHGLIEP